MTALASITATILLTFAIAAVLLYLHDGPIDTSCPSWMPKLRRKPSRVRILSGAHANHFGALETVGNTGKAKVRLRSGVVVWVQAGEWVRVSP
jgi:hypothetical protein